MDLIHNNEKRGEIIWKVKVGSHAYGTNIEGSDEDFKGIYLQDPNDVLNRGYQEQVEISKDETMYELRRFLDLCCTGNPTMMEILCVPSDCIVYKHPIMDLLLPHVNKFLSKSCKWSYGGYAIDQIKKASGLDKKMNWSKEDMVRKTLLDFCYIYEDGTSVEFKKWLKARNYKQHLCGLTAIPHFRYGYNLYYDHVKDLRNDNPKMQKDSDFDFKGVVQDEEKSNDISLSSIPKHYKLVEAFLYCNKDEYQVHCKKYKSYLEWLKNRNTQRYVDVEGHGQAIDGKNLLHCVRLVEMGLEIAQGKGINVRRPNAEYLISIRKGKHDLKTILTQAENTIKEMEEAFDSPDCKLEDKCDRGFFMSLMVRMRKEYYTHNLFPAEGKTFTLPHLTQEQLIAIRGRRPYE